MFKKYNGDPRAYLIINMWYSKKKKKIQAKVTYNIYSLKEQRLKYITELIIWNTFIEKYNKHFCMGLCVYTNAKVYHPTGVPKR